MDRSFRSLALLLLLIELWAFVFLLYTIHTTTIKHAKSTCRRCCNDIIYKDIHPSILRERAPPEWDSHYSMAYGRLLLTLCLLRSLDTTRTIFRRELSRVVELQRAPSGRDAFKQSSTKVGYQAPISAWIFRDGSVLVISEDCLYLAVYLLFLSVKS